jgi:DNA-directed RNA polymerase subunit RPC12/RpoP
VKCSRTAFEVVEKWKYKCNNCSKEFQYAPTPDNPDEQPFEANGDNFSSTHPRKKKAVAVPKAQALVCDTCGSNDLVRPVPEHRKTLEALMMEPVNSNQQTLEDVSRQLERDFEIADNAYLLLLKNYHINDTTGEISTEKTVIKEMLRIEPPQVAMIADSDGRIGYDDKRNKIYVCPRFEHRDVRLTEPKCDRCGAQALKAIIEVNSVYSIGIPQPKRVIYGEGEVIWKAGKYKPNLLYGFSPIYSVWSKAMSLSHMDEYIRKYFDKMRPPRGMLVISSRNYETFRKSWDVLEQKAQEDPYMIHPLLVENDKGGKNPAQWLDFTGSLKELEFIEVRKELRMIIGAVYGVLPFYYGETPAGWSQEGLQVTITNRAVLWGQDTLKKAFFSKIAKMLNIDDWELQLKTGEETDKLRDLQTDGIEIQNMMMLQQMGFEITRTHTGEFNISKNSAMTPDMMFGVGAINGNMNGAGKGVPAPKEQTQSFEGEPNNKRPSDIGGTGQGSPTSGSSLSKKSAFPKGITPSNFEVVKNTLQTAVDYDWKKTKTVEELRKATGMTVRDARDIVATEFEGVKRWEDE